VTWIYVHQRNKSGGAKEEESKELAVGLQTVGLEEFLTLMKKKNGGRRGRRGLKAVWVKIQRFNKGSDASLTFAKATGPLATPMW
jgi:hypothetical protein